MSQPFKIAIAGIGGTGGYYGGLLANTYRDSNEVQVNFVARGTHLQAIRQQGLQLFRDAGNVTAHPHRITDNPQELGQLHLILFCCKAYDLEKFAQSFAANITPNTVLLPLLNGVDSTELLQSLYPQAKTLYGCTYLVSKIVDNGVVQMIGDMNQLIFGHPDIDSAGLENIADIFRATGANVSIPDDIRLKTWEKFSFISPLATATSALNSSAGDILGDAAKRAVLAGLMQEIVLLAKAKDIQLPGDIIDTNWTKLERLPAGATSSMHNDFKNHKNTELETLTGYVVQQARQQGIELPVYNTQYKALKEQVVA